MKNSNISNYLKNNGVKLYKSEYAFDKSGALSFLLILEDEGAFILGGDVYFKKNDNFKPLYDNWYSQKDCCSVKESYDKAHGYIRNYKKDGDIFLLLFMNKPATNLPRYDGYRNQSA